MYYFIINPHSKTGHALKHWAKLESYLNAQNISHVCYFTKARGHATQLAQDICSLSDAIKKIVIVGGDGTANEVINGITDYEHVLLGYIPLGSSNDLARGLLIPQDPMTALKRILSCKTPTFVDHGTITFADKTSHKFDVSCGIGYDAAICNVALSSKRKALLNRLRLGKLSYFLIAISEALKTKPTPALLTVDKKQTIKIDQLTFVTAHITKFEGGGLCMAPSALYNDRLLTVCLVTNAKRLKLLLLLPTILFKKHINLKEVKVFHCATLDVVTKMPLVVHTDGEIMGVYKQASLCCTKQQIGMLM